MGMLKPRTEYGDIIDAYLRYKHNKGLLEWLLGHEPFLKMLGSVAGLTILDFGCGPANFSSWLSQLGARIIGVDANAEVIEAARIIEPLGTYHHYRGLLYDLLKHETIDMIIATFSVCLVPDRELRYVLRDMHRLLKPGQKLMILDPNQEKGHGIQYRDLRYHYKEGVKTGDYVDVTLGSGDNAFALPPDIYRVWADYRELTDEAGFDVAQMIEPIPDESWGPDWELERQHPPFWIGEFTRR